MTKRIFSRFSSGLIALFIFSLLISVVSVSFASQEELKKIKHEIQVQGKRWDAAENEISRLPDHGRKMRLGLIKDKAAPAGIQAAPDTSSAFTAAAPASFDWRNVDGYTYVSGIRNQGSCGSCWAFATAAALESNVLIATGINSNLAEQILVSCGNAGSCNGGYITTASNYIRDTGLPGESYYPYTATNGACGSAGAGWQNTTSRVTSWHYVGNTSNPTLDQIKNELVTYGPLVTTFDVYSDFYSYSNGVYQYTTGTYQGGHAVLIVGYDDPGQYFIVKNSWGSGWGESGYFRIGYSEMNNKIYFGDWTLAYFTDTAPPSVTVAAPNGGESWGAGTAKTIQWNYTGAPGTTAKIDLYSNGMFAANIASSVSIGSGGAGSYSWDIPQSLAGGSYQVMITSNQDPLYSDMSDGNFAVTAYVPPSITLTSPNGAETWSRNTTQTITWNYSGNPGSYAKIELLKAGTSVKTIASKASIAAGNYGWKVPTRQATGSDYKIRITSTTNSSVTDMSDNTFSIK